MVHRAGDATRTCRRPSFTSSRRNCQLWKPEDFSSADRNSMKSSADIVSRIANWSTSSCVQNSAQCTPRVTRLSQLYCTTSVCKCVCVCVSRSAFTRSHVLERDVTSGEGVVLFYSIQLNSLLQLMAHRLDKELRTRAGSEPEGTLKRGSIALYSKKQPRVRVLS